MKKMMLDQLPTHPSMYSHDFWWQFTMHCSLASSSFDGWLNHQCSPLSHNLFHTFSILPPWIVHTFPVTSLHCSSWNSRNSPGFPPKTAQNRPKHPRFSPCFRHGAVAPIAGMAPGHHAAIRLQHREAARGAVPDEVRTADHGGDLERWWGWESWGDDVFVGDFCRESWESVRIRRYS